MRIAALSALALLAACGRDDGGNGAVAGGGVEADVAAGEAQAPRAWRYAGSDEAPEARFGDGDAAPVFAIRCDREGQLLRLRVAPGSDDASLLVAADQAERRLPLVPAGDRLEAELLLADPFVAAMAAPGTRLRIAVGSAPPTDLPGGAAVRRTVEACRTPVEERMAGAVYAGGIPGGEETILMFEAARPGPGRAIALRRPQPGGPVARAAGTVVEDIPLGAPLFRFDPDEPAGPRLWFEIPDDRRIILRGNDGIPDPGYDANPLTRRR